MMEAPKRATKFAANDEWGKVYRNLFGQPKMNQSLSILTGATAGATEAFVVVPFELVKIRLQGMIQDSESHHRKNDPLTHTVFFLRQSASKQIQRHDRLRHENRSQRRTSHSLPRPRIHHLASRPLEQRLLWLYLTSPRSPPTQSNRRQETPDT